MNARLGLSSHPTPTSIPVLQRKASAVASFAPPIVGEVLRSSGRPLDAATRAAMEPRFGHDFSRVRVHADAQAGESARSIRARAYTAGQEVVFGAGQYAPDQQFGRRILAHELMHVLQQEQSSGSPETIPGIAGAQEASEREARQAVAEMDSDVRISDPQVRIPHQINRLPQDDPFLSQPSGTGATTTSQAGGTATLPPASSSPFSAPTLPRGPNPAACMAPLCDHIARPPLPSTDDQLRQRVNTWLTDALACVRTGARGSNATHFAEIQANNETELQEAADTFLQDFNGMSSARRSFHRREAVGWLQDTCQRRQREAQIEFNYNIVLENPRGGLPWGFQPAEWNDIEGALAGLPVEATWLNPTLLRFNRQACHPDDVDSSGQCRGRGTGAVRSFVGGETDTSTSGLARITIFNEGLGQSPYGRSSRLGLPRTFQTLRHEIGHVVTEQIPLAARRDFFDNLLGWRQYSMTLLQQTTTDLGRGERFRLCLDLDLVDRAGDCDQTQLTAFLAQFAQPGSQVTQGRRTYIGNEILVSILTSQLPPGIEFSYALTNQGDYLTELYTLAVSRPEWLHTVLPAEQIAWLKTNVFNTPVDLNTVANQIALRDPQRTEFLIRGRRLFTREQLNQLLNELMLNASPAAQGGQVV